MTHEFYSKISNEYWRGLSVGCRLAWKEKTVKAVEELTNQSVGRIGECVGE